jgi:hypothetical protein
MGSLPSASSTTSSQSQTRQRRRATRSTVAELLERTGMCAFCHYAIGGNKRGCQTFLCDDFARNHEAWGMLERSGMVATLLDSEAYARSQGASCHVSGVRFLPHWTVSPTGGNDVEYRCRDCGQRWTVRIAPTRWETAMRDRSDWDSKEPPSPASLSSPDTSTEW